jgi:hypothetical protein
LAAGGTDRANATVECRRKERSYVKDLLFLTHYFFMKPITLLIIKQLVGVKECPVIAIPK